MSDSQFVLICDKCAWWIKSDPGSPLPLPLTCPCCSGTKFRAEPPYATGHLDDALKRAAKGDTAKTEAGPGFDPAEVERIRKEWEASGGTGGLVVGPPSQKPKDYQGGWDRLTSFITDALAKNPTAADRLLQAMRSSEKGEARMAEPERPRLSVVGHCPDCGRPIYGPTSPAAGSVPHVQDTCVCAALKRQPPAYRRTPTATDAAFIVKEDRWSFGDGPGERRET